MSVYLHMSSNRQCADPDGFMAPKRRGKRYKGAGYNAPSSSNQKSEVLVASLSPELLLSIGSANQRSVEAILHWKYVSKIFSESRIHQKPDDSPIFAWEPLLLLGISAISSISHP